MTDMTGMKQKVCRLLCLLLGLAVPLTGCGNGQSGTGQSAEAEGTEVEGINISALGRQAVDHVFSLNFDPTAGTNPIRAASAANMQFWSLLYDSVFTVDEDFETVTSQVITDYTTADAMWWIFQVNTDLRFSDGTPLNAWDVAYSIQRAQQSEYYSGRLACIYGCSAIDNGSFAISTKYADTQLPARLNIPVIRRGDYFEDDPVGTGPYMLTPARDALVLNPESTRAKDMPLEVVYLKDYMDASTRITAFEDASIDIVTNDPTGMYNLGYGSGSEVRYYDTTNLHYIGFNTQGNYFQSSQARQAVAHLIDREEVAGVLMNGCAVPTALPVHPHSAYYDAEYAAGFDFDPLAAAALFEAAGVEDLDDDGELEMRVTGIVVELDLKFLVNNDSTIKVAAARRIAAELNALGIKTTLYVLSWEDYLSALAKGEFDLYYGEIRVPVDWDLSYLFAIPGLSNRERGNWGQNYARTMDETYTQLYQNYLGASEFERYGTFQELARYMGETSIILPICFERRQVLTHWGVVSNIHATQHDLFNRFSEWTIALD